MSIFKKKTGVEGRLGVENAAHFDDQSRPFQLYWYTCMYNMHNIAIVLSWKVLFLQKIGGPSPTPAPMWL